MKRKLFIAHLQNNKCTLVREGGNHSLFRNNENGKMTSVPRHPNIDDLTCAKICKQLGIPYPGKN